MSSNPLFKEVHDLCQAAARDFSDRIGESCTAHIVIMHDLLHCLFVQPSRILVDLAKLSLIRKDVRRQMIHEAMASWACYQEYDILRIAHRRATNKSLALRPVLHAYRSGRWQYWYERFEAAHTRA